jgi:hypothetical protein
MNPVTISAKELIQLANRIKDLENVLIQISALADPDARPYGFESEKLKCIWKLATKVTAEDCSVDGSIS